MTDSLPIVDPKFEALIPPLTDEEVTRLERSLLTEGCRDALVVWQETGVLLDGHNRLRICQEHGVPFRTVGVCVANRDAAEDWIDANQLGRRNLSPDVASFIRGRMYNRTKKAMGAPAGNSNAEKQRAQIDPLVPKKLVDLFNEATPGAQTRQPASPCAPVQSLKAVLAKDPEFQPDVEAEKVRPAPAKTAERLAVQHGVSPATIKRDGQFAAAVEAAKTTNPDIEKQVMAGKVNRSAVIRSVKAQEIKAKLEDLVAREVAEPTGVYDVVVMDPPWPMQKIERDCRPNQVEFDYPTMNEKELSELVIPASDDCHLFLWTTHKFLPMAFRLLEGWGFNYVFCMVWHKPGGFQPIGLPQYNCEFALYGRKGTPSFLDTKAFPTCFNADRGRHSEKPEEFYDLLRRVTGGRRLDMFNRREIEGFDRWGNES